MSLPSPLDQQTEENNVLNIPVLELLASRICHDLISPVGAMHNGVEFMEEMGADADDEALQLISHSAQQASAKLQAFRLAYGAGGRDSHVKPEDVYKVFADLITGEGKIAQEWDPHGAMGFEELPQAYCKIFMGVLMIAQECLPRGGTISVQAGEKNQTLISAEGKNAAPRPLVHDALAGTLSIESLDPRLVHPYVIALLARHYHFTISITEEKKDQVIFSLSQ